MVSGTFHQIFNLTFQQRLECHTSLAGSRIFKQEADNACSIFGCYTIKLEGLLLANFSFICSLFGRNDCKPDEVIADEALQTLVLTSSEKSGGLCIVCN